MIRINTPGPGGIRCEDWLVKAANVLERDLEIWRGGGRPEPISRIWKELKVLFLEPLFFGKCAYCEGNYRAGYWPDVEHFRPKRGVTEDRKWVGHPGYFWLAYEWYNLLLVCARCNVAKGNEFKIEGARVGAPDEHRELWLKKLAIEKPLLLNPYFDDPMDHIRFEGLFCYGLTNRGRETVRVCELNRIELVEARVNLVELVNARLIRDFQFPAFACSEAFSAFLNEYSRNIIQGLIRGRLA
jgi:hypothetical protein